MANQTFVNRVDGEDQLETAISESAGAGDAGKMPCLNDDGILDSSFGTVGDPGASAYVYIAFASDDSGTGFTNTFDAGLNYIAIKSTDTEIPTPVVGDFAGLWKNYKGEDGAPGAPGIGVDGNDGQDAYLYIGYASDAAGTDYSDTFSISLPYIALRQDTGPVLPDASYFAGLWVRYIAAIAGSDTEIQFNNSGVLGASSNLTFDTTDDKLSVTGGVNIGASPPTLDTVNVDGTILLNYTSAESDDHAMELIVNSSGFGDVKALDIEYKTGALAGGGLDSAVLVQIDESLATGGDISGLEVLTTTIGSLDKAIGLFSGVGVDPLEHLSGTFANADSILDIAADVLTALSTGGAGNISVFENDNETLTIGSSAKFEELEFILDTPASGSGIAPTWEFSTGVGTWSSFTPSDGTNAFRNTGNVVWLDGDIPTWATGTGGEYLIRVTRTRNSMSTTPILDLVQVAAATEYYWNKSADLLINSVTMSNTGLHLADTNASHDLIVAPGSDLSADRTLTLTTGDSDRTITLTGDASLTGTNTGDEAAASTTVSGVIELATQAEADAGTDTSRAITPDTLSNYTGFGDVSKVGTPVDNEIGVWTGAGTLEGDADLTWDGTTLTALSEGTAESAVAHFNAEATTYPTAGPRFVKMSTATAPFKDATVGTGLLFTQFYSNARVGGLYVTNAGNLVLENNIGTQIGFSGSYVAGDNFLSNGTQANYQPGFATDITSAKEAGIYTPSAGNEKLIASVSRLDQLTVAKTGVGIFDTTPSAALEVVNTTTTQPALIVKGASGQTGNIVEVVDNSANELFIIDDDGTAITKKGRIINVTDVNAATYDLLVSDDILHVSYTATAAVTSLTLPTAQVTEGRIIKVKDTGNAATNNITIDTEGGETIDGNATLVMSTDYQAVEIYCDGTNWFII